MGKIVGLAGALAAFGAVAYLTAPLPPQSASTSSVPTPSSSAGVIVPVAAPSQRIASAGSPPDETQQTLVHQIQAELRQLGCYDGAIDGRWSEATQRAMRTLGERASVLRPVDTPDYIMLALARSQPSDICATRHDRPPPSRMTALGTPSASSAPHAGEVSAVRPPRTTPSRTAASTNAGSIAPQPWHISVQRASPSQSRQVAQVRPAEQPVAATNLTVLPSRTPDYADRPSLESPRMGLGAVDVDPLRAGVDPRNPNATAILRGAPAAADIGGGVTSATPPVDAARIARPAVRAPVADERSLPLHRQSKRAFQRNVFTEMMRNGP
jgi:hypothetical protein